MCKESAKIKRKCQDLKKVNQRECQDLKKVNQRKCQSNQETTTHYKEGETQRKDSDLRNRENVAYLQ